MRPAHLQVRELVERAVENQARQEYRRLERIADDVAEAAASGQRVLLNQVRGAVWMHERELPEILYLRPEHVELRQRQAFAVDVPADGDAASAEPLRRVFEHCDRDVRELQWDRSHRHEAIGMLAAPRRQRLVVLVADGPREALVF